MPTRLRHVERLLDTLRELEPKFVKKALRKALRNGAKVIAKAVRSRCPVASGDLKKSIRVRAGKRSRRKGRLTSLVIVGAKMQRRGKPVYYVAPFEYGSFKQAPQPFVRPGFDASVRSATDAVAATLRAEIRNLRSP